MYYNGASVYKETGPISHREIVLFSEIVVENVELDTDQNLYFDGIIIVLMAANFKDVLAVYKENCRACACSCSSQLCPRPGGDRANNYIFCGLQSNA